MANISQAALPFRTVSLKYAPILPDRAEWVEFPQYNPDMPLEFIEGVSNVLSDQMILAGGAGYIGIKYRDREQDRRLVGMFWEVNAGHTVHWRVWREGVLIREWVFVGPSSGYRYIKSGMLMTWNGEYWDLPPGFTFSINVEHNV